MVAHKYNWMGDENGKEMLAYMEELKKKTRDLPLTGSLAVGVDKGITDAIESKAIELKIPKEEAISYFFSLLK